MLYHSSDTIVKYPDLQHSREYLDFGKGFYLTHFRDQAVKYGERFIRRGKEAWLNIYNFDFVEKDWDIKVFDKYDKEWLDFIGKCRNGDDDTSYEMIIGGIANDKVIRTLDRYFNGEITENEALGLLKFERPNIQYCLRSVEMLEQCLKFINAERL